MAGNGIVRLRRQLLKGVILLGLVPATSAFAQSQEENQGEQATELAEQQISRAFTPRDVLNAVEWAAVEFGVSYQWMLSIVRCETGGTFNPYSIGKQGELGAVQLHPRGELRRFYTYGYSDPFDPWEAVPFLARRLRAGGGSAWSCA